MFAEFRVDSNKSREHDFTTIALIVSIVLSRCQKDLQKSGLFLIDCYRNLQIKIVMIMISINTFTKYTGGCQDNWRQHEAH